jgi:hypothetical protein
MERKKKIQKEKIKSKIVGNINVWESEDNTSKKEKNKR